MADTFKGIITADGKKRQLPYRNIIETPVSDETLSIQGAFADSKAVGDKFKEAKAETDSLKEDLDNYIHKPNLEDDDKFPRAKNGSVEWVEQGLPTDEQTSSAINSWLNAHPDATTTVQDGAITENKINANFLHYIKNGYFTPEMFGAIGNGIADDTESVQKCLDFKKNNGYNVFLSGKYKITNPLIITGYSINIFGNGQILYDGIDFAIKIHGCVNSNITLNRIDAPNGRGIYFYGTSNKDFNQYINLYINNIHAKDICIKHDKNHYSWSNEIRIYNTRFSSTNYTAGNNSIALQINSDGTEPINGWHLTNVGFEGIDIGVELKNTDISKDRSISIALINLRFGENIRKIIKTSGYCYFELLTANKYTRKDFFELSNLTWGVIYGNVTSEDYGYLSSTCIIDKGLFCPTNLQSNNLSFTDSRVKIDLNEISTYLTNINIRTNNDCELILNEYYNYKGIREFKINVFNQGTNLTIKNRNNVVIGTLNNLKLAVYTLYFIDDNNTLNSYYCSK